MKPMHTITKDVSVGIYNSEYTARIYKDKIIVVSPYVKWVGNTGGYAESKQSIRDQEIIDEILTEMADDCKNAAWGLIGEAIGDPYLDARY